MNITHHKNETITLQDWDSSITLLGLDAGSGGGAPCVGLTASATTNYAKFFTPTLTYTLLSHAWAEK